MHQHNYAWIRICKYYVLQCYLLTLCLVIHLLAPALQEGLGVALI